RRILIEWNSGRAVYPANACIHELFEQQAARNPDAIAAVDGSESISYRELDRRANQIADALIRRGAGPEQRVVICMDKSLRSLAGVLGILKSGAAFVPLDPRLPEGRLDEILAEVEPAVILAESSSLHRFTSQPAPVLSLDSGSLNSIAQEGTGPAARVSPDNLAYIIYTSGSTGRPKAVAIEHRHVVCFLHSFRPHPNEAEPRRGTSVSSLTFDLFIEEVFSCLCFGGTVHLLHPQQFLDPVYFARYLKVQRINTAYLYPDLLQPVARELKRLGGAPDFCTLITGLQPKKFRVLQAWRELGPALRILNAYGPTEVTYGATAYELSEAADPDADVPIGKPFANYSVYLLDAHGQPVPPGVVGEIHIGGPCVARGYWRRPEETSHAFLLDPFASQPGARMYKTGDLGRFLPDGNIEFLGRADRQVKLRGYRIELEEIENALRSHPAVALAAVSEWEPAPGDKALAAYVVPQKGASVNKQVLRSFLETRLPHYMIPADWVFLEDMPRTSSFKIDWRALPKPSRKADEAALPRGEPLNQTQAKLLAIWRQLLGTERIGLDDDFFESGGHSLLAVRFFLELEKQLGVRLPPGVIFEAPTIRKLAQLLKQEPQPRLRALVSLRREGRRAPLFLVHAHEGSVFLYRRLAQRLGPDQPVYGLQAVTLDFGAETHPRFEDIAAEFVREIRSVQPRGPYCLAGFCAGAYLAFEAACQLQAEGERVALLGILNTPGDWRQVRSFADSLRYHGGILRSLPSAAIPLYFLERLRYRWLRVQDSSLRHALRLCRIQDFGRLPAWLRTCLLRDAHVRAARRYDPHHRFRGNLICLQATGDAMRDPLPYWGRLVEGEVVTLRVPGRGRSVLEEPHVAELAKALDALLEEVNRATAGTSR
ncbi:MAG: amino acid adenylation domain-containing protein, partial [Bryobacteraceae bacterium]|nr:amino acid adenylation domain-containing protein [Bryobacteraceae bacterium]